MKLLKLNGTVDLQAAQGNGSPKVVIAAYGGGVIRPSGIDGDVVIDLAGLTFDATVPLLVDHDSTLGGIVGRGSPAVLSGQLGIEGQIIPGTEAGNKILALAKGGFSFQASVGVDVTERQFIQAGETVQANGQTFTAGPRGLTLAKGVLREVSILAIGADATTSVSIAAMRGKNMTFEEWLGELGFTMDQLSEEQKAALQKAYAAEHPAGGDVSAHGSARLKALSATALRCAKEFPNAIDIIDSELEAAMQDSTMNADQFELNVIRASRPQTVAGVRQSTRAVTRNQQDVLCASLMLRAGNENLAVKAYGEQTVEAAHRSQIRSLVDLARASLVQTGRSPHDFDSTDSMLRAAFSSVSLPNILSNVVGRSLVSAYEETTSDWRAFCFVGSAEDFKQQKGIRPAAVPNLEQIGAAGEIKHGVLGEEATYTWQVGTYAKMLSITRQDMINDDLGFLSQLSPMMGQAAGRSLLDLIWTTIMGGETAGFFHSDNANLLTSSAALAVGSLGTAVAAMRSQRDSQGYDLNINPAVLAVPPGLELTARNLLASPQLFGTTAETTGLPNGNPVQGIVPKLVVESRLANTVRFSNADADNWFLFGNPASRPVTVGFLQGKQTPTVEIEPAPFNTLGTQMRVYFDYAVALSDPKAAYKAKP